MTKIQFRMSTVASSIHNTDVASWNSVSPSFLLTCKPFIPKPTYTQPPHTNSPMSLQYMLLLWQISHVAIFGPDLKEMLKKCFQQKADKFKVWGCT